MGSSLNQGGYNGRGRRRSYRPMSDINVTPFVDVMLVLLVVFMVTAPLMTAAVPLDLPKTQAKTMAQDKEPLVVSIDPKGDVFVQDRPTDLDGLVDSLKAISGVNPDARIFVRGDKGVPYGRIMEVMGTISAAGFNKVALVTDLAHPDGGGSSATPKNTHRKL
jgi:biopolymer transport protein TolR